MYRVSWSCLIDVEGKEGYNVKDKDSWTIKSGGGRICINSRYSEFGNRSLSSTEKVGLDLLDF